MHQCSGISKSVVAPILIQQMHANYKANFNFLVPLQFYIYLTSIVMRTSGLACVPHMPKFVISFYFPSEYLFPLSYNYPSFLPSRLKFYSLYTGSLVLPFCYPFICRLVVPPDGQQHTLHNPSSLACLETQVSKYWSQVCVIYFPSYLLLVVGKRINEDLYIVIE